MTWMDKFQHFLFGLFLYIVLSIIKPGVSSNDLIFFLFLILFTVELTQADWLFESGEKITEDFILDSGFDLWFGVLGVAIGYFLKGLMA